MQDLDWPRVRALFAAASELPEAARAAYVRAAADGDDALRVEVESLLAHHGNDDDELEPPPASIGEYRIIERLGRGGMGVVYRAEQDHPKRQVALKVLSRAAASPRAQRRFDHEAELLARLQHVGIAQVFAAGHADAGAGVQPFLAMELIDGEPLDACARRLTRPARCELLAKVADAVHHAHQKGVIHCDLKPGNVLVDASGQPKVLDFGIARTLDDDRATSTLRTSQLQVAGTLAYMSPEQTTGDAHALDVRTDVYALGVITYELLCGHLPLDLDGKDLLAALASIRAEEPLALGARDKSLRGDLATIVHKALAKERDQRYASASEFAADLRRYLRDDPIAARPPSTVYALRKFAKRHAALVATASTAAIALLLGIITTSIGMARAVRAEHRATRAKDYLRERILSISPHQAGGEVKLVEVIEQAADHLDQAFADDPVGRAEMALALASTLRSLGRYPRATALSRSALESLQRARGDADPRTKLAYADLGASLVRESRRDEAASTLRAFLAMDVRDLPAAEVLAARATYADLLAASGQTELAATELAAVAEQAASTQGVGSLAYLSAQALLADLRVRCGAPEEGTRGLRDALAAVEAQHGPDHPVALQLRYSLTTSLAQAGHAAQAQQVLEELLPRLVRVLGDEHPSTRHARCSLAIALQEQRRLDEAEALLAPVRSVVTERDASEAGLRTRITMANLRAHGGHMQDAADIARPAAEDADRALGPDAPMALDARGELVHALASLQTADANAELDILLQRLVAVAQRRDTLLTAARMKAGTALMNLGRFADAEQFFRQLVASLPATERETSATGIEAQDYLLFLFLQTGRLRDAAELGDTLLPAARRVRGERTPSLLNLMHNHAGVLRRLERFDEALALYRECLGARLELCGEDHHETRTTRLMYTLALIDAGQADAAQAMVHELLHLEERLDPTSDTTINAHALSARVLLVRGDHAAAATELEAVLARFGPGRPPEDDTLSGVRGVLAEAYLRGDRATQAESHAQHNLATLASTLPGTWEHASGQALHGRCLAALGRHAEAEPLLTAAIAIFDDKLGPENSRTVRARKALAQLYDATGRAADAAAVRSKLGGS